MNGAVLVVTGDELLRGFIRDSHVEYISRGLRSHSVTLHRAVFSPDDPEVLTRTIEGIIGEVDPTLLIITGGLGPTHDDRTSEIVAAVCGRDLELNEAALTVIEQRVATLGRNRGYETAIFDAGNRKQAMLPHGATWFTPAGTAPGYVLQDNSGRTIVVLPGPPAELTYAWEAALASDELKPLLSAQVKSHERLIRIWGRPEAFAASELERLGHEDSDACRVTLCARHGELELSLRGSDAGAIDELTGHIVNALEPFVFAVDDERPVSEMVGAALVEQSLTLGVGESCTAGMLGARIADSPGASAWFNGGCITYSYEAKTTLLGVPTEMLVEHGAVSEQVAEAMVRGVQRQLNSQAAIAITGVSGPSGGTEEKPVGTVVIAVALGERLDMQRWHFVGDRTMVRERSCSVALHTLRRLLTQV